MIEKIKKRNGRVVDFNEEKIINAIYKAAEVVAKENGKSVDRIIAERVADKISAQLELRFKDTTPTVEQIQDLVERELIKSGYADTAKNYILYRQHHKEIRERSELENSLINDVVRTVKDYTGGDDWKVKENANTGSVTNQRLKAHLASKATTIAALNEMYRKEDPEIRKLHEERAIHIHDLSDPFVAYCCGHSTEQLIQRGFGEVAERVQSAPAKHLVTIVEQMVNYIGTMQGEFAGAQAFSSVDTFLAPFVKLDNLTQQEVDQAMQMLIYGLNVPSRWGWQAPFSNLTFDSSVPEDLKDKKVKDVFQWLDKSRVDRYLFKEKELIKEKYEDFFTGESLDKYFNKRKSNLEEMLNSSYGSYQKEMNMINRGFLKTMKEGDKSGRPFTFPIPTYNLTNGFDWDSEIAEELFEVTGKYGSPYFQNYIGSGLDPGEIRAMCCRLNLDQKELRNRPGGLWGPGDSTGSIGVVTINMNRVGYEAKNEKEFFDLLGHRMDVASKSLEIKRKTVEELLEKGFVPYTKSYLGHFSNHFSTIGLCGMNEACVNFLGEDISTEKGKEFTIKTLNFMREKIKGYQNETGNLYNLEATPAESTSYRFARKDKEIYPNIFTSGEKEPFLTNSTQLPVNLEMDLYSALQHQGDIQPLYTGGTIFHTFVGEQLDGESAKNLVRKIAETTKLPYFSITPIFSICPEHGYLKGKNEKCTHEKCEEKTEIYDRIVGYYRPVSLWNVGKQEEERLRSRLDKKENYIKTQYGI